MSGLLSSVEVFFNSQNLSQGISFFVNTGAPWQSDTHDFQTNLSLVSGWNSVDVSSAGIPVSVGAQFTIGIQGLGPDTFFHPSFRGTRDTLEPSYAGGVLYRDGSVFMNLGSTHDMNFRTFVEPVPEPTVSFPVK